jgi:type IV fimbrial biogenesis protein FimT
VTNFTAAAVRTSARRARTRGFGVVELCITLAVLAIAVGLALPSFSAWIQNSRTRGAAESIQTGLQLARSEAVRRNANVGFALNPAPGVMWRVCCDAAGAVVQQRSLAEGNASGLVLTQPAEVGTFTFNGLGRVANWSTTWGNAYPITVAPAQSGDALRSLRVELGASGTVRMCSGRAGETVASCLGQGG